MALMFLIFRLSQFHNHFTSKVYNKIMKPDGSGKITNLREFIEYKGGDTSLIVPKPKKTKAHK